MESETTARPIIRIEIQNDIASNQMDVDTAGEIEDGEVSGEDKNSEDCDDENKKMDVVNSKTANVGSKWWNKEGGFSTGFDIFSKNEQEKLTVRARRFGIHPNESKAITDAELQELYDSLNITPGDEKMVRFDALHMRGVEEMSTKDVFGYFSLYAPSSIEWINDYSCNVVWQDNVSASRALHGLSKRINGFDFTDEENPFVPKEPEDPEAAEEEEKALNSRKGRSILLISQEDEANNAVNNEDWESEEPIDITEISIPIPPGYWRYGQPHPKAKSILLRFAFKTDKKPFKAEKLSEYYKKYGNPNFGGMKGLISQSRKRQLKGGLTERQVLVADDIDIDPTGKNPWGTLAERWSNEDRGVVFNEPKEIIREPFKEQRIIITNKSLQERIGVKRRISQTNSLDDESETVESSEPKRKKIPRMRMYADEEQERINRLKTLKKMSQTKKVEVIDKQIVREQFHSRTVLENNTDLRNRLLQTDKRRLPEITVRVPQTIIEDKRSISHRFENRLGSKVTKNTFRSSSQYEDDRVHYRISERVYQSEEEDLLEEDDYIPDTRQRSTVKVVVRNRPEPKIQSTISRGTSSSRRSGESRSWRMSDREQFRSKRYEDERDRRSSDLRSKISDSKSRSSKLLRIKKEPSSDSSESSDSESESSSSESGSSSSDSDSSSDEPQPKKHTSVLKKTALPVIKSDKKLLAGAKDTLRIEVHNDSYKKT